MFNVGDVVRLNRGWTPMIVLHVEDGDVWATYACRNPSFPITQWHYKNYVSAYHYCRPCHGFTAWDGEPINTDWNYLMPRRYRTIVGPVKAGKYMNTTSNGDYILELDNGQVVTIDPEILEEDFPDTFRVKSMHNNYSCHYEVPNGVNIQKNDVLISDSANIYVVMETNTKNRNPKGVFKGSRLVKEGL